MYSSVLPTEPGRDDVRSTGYGGDSHTGGGYGDDDSSGRGSKKSDSTMGKLMEKVGGMTKNENIREKGEMKRREAGGSDNY